MTKQHPFHTEGRKASKLEILKSVTEGNSDSKERATFAVGLVRKSYLFLAMKQEGSTESPERCQNSFSLVTGAVTCAEGAEVPNS